MNISKLHVALATAAGTCLLACQASNPQTDSQESASASVAPELVNMSQPETFSYDPIDLDNELIEPLPNTVEELFEDYLEMDYEPAKISLGQALFHDTRLSTDNTISCASCHDLRYGGIDRAVTATGVRGQVGPINTPTVFNAVFNVHQFWDGRAADLEAQADGPPNAGGEMASNWVEITGKLEQDGNIMSMLHAAFPDADFSEGIESKYWLQAIAEFEKTLITPNAPFDQYMLGDEDAISEGAKEGYQIFKDLNCVECHNGIAVGGKSMQRLGRDRPYFNDHTAAANLGRFNVTGDEADRNVFKVGTLRNVAVTGPWLHDGSQESLNSTVRVMAEYQLGVTLTDGQAERLVLFLESLTGEFEGQSLNRIQNTVDSRNSGSGN